MRRVLARQEHAVYQFSHNVMQGLVFLDPRLRLHLILAGIHVT